MRVDSKKIYFIHITKTAGTSIDQALTFSGGTGRKHETVTEAITDISLQTFESFHSFCVVRNPWDRLVSLYHDRKQNKNRIHNVSFTKWLTDMPAASKMTRSKREMDWYSDPRCIQTHLYWITHDNRILVNEILRFENLQKEWEVFRAKFGLQPLPHLYQSQHKNYREYYTDETRDLVAERYQDDIEQFEYDF